MAAVAVAAGATAAPNASARLRLWWEPRASEFWTVNYAAIWQLFDNGQCTEWAAIRRPMIVRRIVEGQIARDVRRRQPEMLTHMDARFWVADAKSVGVAVGRKPRPRALVVFQPGVLGAGDDGHIAYVERVFPGGPFEVSQMNAPRRYRVTYEWLPRSVARLRGVRFIY